MILNNGFIRGLISKVIVAILKKKFELDAEVFLHELNIVSVKENGDDTDLMDVKLGIEILAQRDDISNLVTKKLGTI